MSSPFEEWFKRRRANSWFPDLDRVMRNQLTRMEFWKLHLNEKVKIKTMATTIALTN